MYKTLQGALTAALLLAVTAATTSHANTIVYDNGSATSGGFQNAGFLLMLNGGSEGYEANHFTLDSSNTVNAAQIGVVISQGAQISALNWYIMANPFDPNSTPLYQGSATNLSTSVVMPNMNGWGLDYGNVSFDFGTDISLAAGTYYFALSKARGADYVTWQSDSSATNTTPFYYGYGELGSVDYGNANQFGDPNSGAFQLYGPSPIPEPSTYALIISLSALTLVVLARRKKA
jgi:hypothetical protein